ncbi:DUF4350 domain-containing protein [uncultured Methanobacterium sp.]|uniref:DUF4350 domain-containing protein n=1 Tax=uncultured Methanobacterium sp. TaxID=176306 RepID=UPI002AA83931|nr:DUF4350 domain-containing protein [uncultured Methanobacterium sp.]
MCGFRINTHLFLFFFILSIIVLSLGSCTAQDSKRVLFDESGSYGKLYTIYNSGASGTSVFANLLQENGFKVSTDQGPLTPEKLKNYDVVVMMFPYRNYTNQEIIYLKEYVSNGGGLLLVGNPWGVEDGDSHSIYNRIANGFGVDFAYNVLVVDPNENIGLSNFIKVTDLRSNPLTSNIDEIYYMQGTYLSNPGCSTVAIYSGKDSWADNLFLTSEGYSQNNQLRESNETGGPLPLYSTMEYGKGKIVFAGSAASFTNLYIYRSNGWKLGLNSVNWLSNNPIPSEYKTAGVFSLTLGDLGYRVSGTILLAILIIISLFFIIKREKKVELSRVIKTIKNWKYYVLIGFNLFFTVLGAIMFFPVNFMLFDRTQFLYYDPYFGYTLLITGLLFLLFNGIILYNIIFRERIPAKYNYFNLGILLIFAGFTIFLGPVFSFPMMEIFTIGSLILLAPGVINYWFIHNHGYDLIIEGKEFNRLAKLSIKSLPYELHSLYHDAIYLGEGGFGRVYHAKTMKGEDVAIKIPKSFDKRAEKTFISEVSNWSQLNHPNIVQLYNFKILPIPYIEMEYCERALEHGKKPLDESINIVYESAKGLSYAHGKNIIHGDVKTSNIMSHNGVYKVSDWGLSKMTTGESVTLSGATPQYAAPEQISYEFGKSDERTDIYQLGVVFYELVTGQLPFEGEISVVYGSILNSDPVPPSHINPKAQLVEPIIMKCLNKIKKERYNSMEQLIEELEDYRKPSDETIIMEKD